MTAAIDEQMLWGGLPSAPCSVLSAAVDGYVANLPRVCAGTSDADLIAELHALERERRRLAAADHLLLAEIGRRGVAARAGFGTVSRFVQSALRLSPADAARRVAAAELAGPRVAMSGQPLPPVLPQVAEAATAGDIGPEHVAVLGRVLDEVPAEVPVEEFAAAERTLTEAAVSLPPKQVADVGRRLIALLDPDGRAPSEAEARRHRRLSLTERADGSLEGSFRLAPVAGAKLVAVLTGQAAPMPADDGSPDPRSYPQRLADALEDLCDLGLRAGQLVPGGPSVQLIVTMTAEQFAAGTGLAETSHGQLLPVGDAIRLAGEADICRVVTDTRGAVLNLARSRRCASRSQTLALHARDRGCSFPGCSKPTDWCQRHHVVPWAQGGRTDLDNLTLVCSLHHREFERWGWSCVMRDGLPTWIPPASIDPKRRPRRNDRGSVIICDP